MANTAPHTQLEQDRLLVIYGEDPREMTLKLLEAAQLEKRIPQGALVGIKPNLVVAKPANTGATTHPEIVAALVEYLQAHGHTNLLILEGAWVGDSTRKAFQLCGYQEISRRYGVPLLDTKGDATTPRSYGGITMEVCQKALEVDYLINLPVLKGHCQTLVTGALKNLKGLISDREKRHFHTLRLHKPIAYLNKILHTDFILGDGICGDLDYEEGGNPVPMHRMFCGLDPVLVDSYIASCMGYQPRSFEDIALAEELGVGRCLAGPGQVVELNRDTSAAKPSPGGKVARLAGYAAPKESCSACYANLIQALARLDQEGLLEKLRDCPVCIGQGYQGQPGRLGVGRCTAAMDASQPGCPPTTMQMLEFLRSQLA